METKGAIFDEMMEVEVEGRDVFHNRPKYAAFGVVDGHIRWCK